MHSTTSCIVLKLIASRTLRQRESVTGICIATVPLTHCYQDLINVKALDAQNFSRNTFAKKHTQETEKNAKQNNEQ